ncbi:FAD-binding oxidoreductase [Streptomyces sp. ISL-11]|uniref:FAD-binding oxidoreductase n=1 Tax=Streptomyces sp. ISL-11 TaxID=2819174 RepID=UPI001BE93A4F|nr:FAD-binding oxidoreductase [Streptomyces sp. ISL-11]MBT2383726.1 FAD-binding oxidoreductase [Streptomyces sp. ISL-11]
MSASASQPSVVGTDDPRYEDLATRGNNKRFTARPREFRVVTSTAEVVEAVGEAVRDGLKIAVRSGGHGYENFTGDPAVQLVIDLGEMRAVSFDTGRRAFMVEPGARLLEDVYGPMYERWGVAVPAGNSNKVGLGGHVQGGGYGSLCRAHGLIVDHLYAVEVVTVDAAGEARAVIATREPDDPHHDLWWALTGGGAGTFGVVTRFWFRSPGATGDDPAHLLPRPPAEMIISTVLFPRPGLDKPALRALVGAFGRWHERNSAPDSPYAHLFSSLVLLGRNPDPEKDMGAVLVTHMDAGRPGAERLLQDFLDEVTGRAGLSPVVLPAETVPWTASKKALGDAQDAEIGRQKVKSANLRRSFSDDQADALFDFLNGDGHANDSSLVAIDSYGGRVGAVAPDDTAVAQRDSVMKVLFMNTWQDAEHDAANLDWMRRFYGAVFAKTGGVPVPGDDQDGCFINFPDTDLADPALNTSGTPWHELYFKDHYARLRDIRAAYDPRGVFGHALSVRTA